MEKIAVIGMSCLLPDAKDYREFWQNLLSKKDSKSKAGFEQMGADPEKYFSPKKGTKDRYYCMEGGFVREFSFDPSGYNLPEDYVNTLDDMHKWSLYVAKEALKDSGYLDNRDLGKSCGLVLGNLSFPTRTSNRLFLPIYHQAVEESIRKLPGNREFSISHFSDNFEATDDNLMISGYPAALISKAFGLTEMGLALDAACSSSIYAVKIACDCLIHGKADMMLAGAVSCADPFFINMGFSIFQAYPSGKMSAPFDKNSGGLVAGEGAGMFVLKRLSDAVKDNDTIHAVISGIGLSNDGKGQSVLSPSSFGQNLAFERAYEKAGVRPDRISFVECHATGTTLGDKVELDSMDTFFGKYGASPYVGTCKSNLGHLLTAANMAGMIKTILALNEKRIPGTICIKEPAQSKRKVISEKNIPQETIPFPESKTGRYAAVSGFGFGGTNAHIVFEKQDSAYKDVSDSRKRDLPHLSIVGMEAIFGPSRGLMSFYQTIFEGLEHFENLPEERWLGMENYPAILEACGLEDGLPPKGAYIDAFDIDFLKFRIPPNKDDQLIPQQLLALKVADAAISDAGIKEGTNTAVLACMGAELSLHRFRGRVNLDTQIEESLSKNGIPLTGKEKDAFIDSVKNSIHGAAQVNQYTSFIGNIMAARISSLWNFNGPAHSISSEENSVPKALEVARMMLASKDAEAVVIVAVDLSGGFENVLVRNRISPVNTGTGTLSFDETSTGWMVGEGAGAIVVKAREKAMEDSDRIYATLRSVAFSNGLTPAHVEDASKKALEMAAVDVADIEYVELSANGVPLFDDAEIKGLSPLYKKNGKVRCAAGSIKSSIGHTYAASGMAAIIKTALCLYQRIIPGTPNFSAPKNKSLWDESRLFVPVNPLTWILGKDAKKRFAAINILGGDFTTSHMILAGENKPKGETITHNVADKSAKSLVKPVKTGGKSIESCILTPENIEMFYRLKRTVPERKIPPSPNPLKDLKEEKDMTVSTVPKVKKEMRITPRKTKTTPVVLAPVPASMNVQEEKYHHNMALLHDAHSAFLDMRKQGLKAIGEIIYGQMDAMTGTGDCATAVLERRPEVVFEPMVDIPEVKVPAIPEKKEIWDQADLLEFAEGNIANVFGDAYAVIDTYKRRVRLPMSEYLLVTRVTELEGETGVFKPSKMTTEYDIPLDSPYIIDGQIPWAVSVESGQCDLLLISYLGIDFDCKGERVYRLLDCTLTFMENIAMAGETLKYEISINSFAKSGESLLFFFSYRCFVEDRLVLKMDGGCAGFFTDEELDAGKGIIHTEEEIEKRKSIQKSSFTPLLTCSKTSFSREDILHIVHGNRGKCFGDNYVQNGLNPSLKFSSEKMLMIDAVTNIDISGGPWGLGKVEAEKILHPDHWYFPCHFKDDQVMAGSLMAEGCGQLLQFYMLYTGLHTRTTDARFQPIKELPQKVRCRGQVTPQEGKLLYRLEVKEIGLTPTPYAIADIDIILDGKIVVDFKNLGVHLVEKTADDPYKMDDALVQEIVSENASSPSKKVVEDRDASALFTQYHLQHFAKGTISECFGPDFKIYDNRTAPRTPNGDLQLTTRVLEAHGKRLDFSKPAYCIAEYDVPPDAWYYENNSHPAVMPYSIIMEIALQPCGFISAYMGTTLKSPDTDFFFRNLDGQGTVFRDIDLRGKTIVNKSTLLTTAAMGNTIIQTFEFEMQVDGEDYYKGTAAFGYFVAAALTDQVGLDNGIDNHPMTEQTYLKDQEVVTIDLKSDSARKAFYQGTEEKPFYRLTGPQLDFLSDVKIVTDGGENGLGYIYAERPINRSDWFFKCHFYQDPVMPGSLGVESVMQALQVFSLALDLGKKFKNPRFTQVEDKIIWKYRGQINPEIDKMAIEVHITAMEEENDKVTVTGKASLWKDKIRIYEVKQISLVIQETAV